MITTIDESPFSNHQHAEPCHDCPFRVTAIPGWLGGNTPEEMLRIALSDEQYPCHAFRGPQCAGIAIFRSNIAKLPRDRAALRLPADRINVFATPYTMLAYHGKRG